jgi:hypothetical protein
VNKTPILITRKEVTMVIYDENDERARVIRENPKHLKCPSCGHEEDVYAAAAIPKGNGEYTLIWGSEADFCTKCEEPWGRNTDQAPEGEASNKSIEELLKDITLEGIANEKQEITQTDINEAIERYPGIPFPLALAKLMMDRALFGGGEPPLHAGSLWGGIHLETVGQLIQKLAEAMYHQTKKSITIEIRSEDFPESYDHLSIELKSVDSGTVEDAERFPLTGWPCCACGKPIPPGDSEAAIIVLPKKATWPYPSWGNVLNGTSGRAAAVVCGDCLLNKKKPTHAVKKDGGMFTLVPLSELEDIDESPNKA